MILTSYLRRQVLKPFVVISLVLVAIFASYMAARYLAQAAQGKIPVTLIGRLIFLRVCIAQEVLLPTTFFFSLLLALGRLYRDAEMVAMFASGFTLSQLYRTILGLALVISILVGFFSLKIRPWAWNEFFSLKIRAQATFDLARFKPGVFYELPGGRIFYAQRLDPKKRTAQEVFIYEESGDLRRVIRAEIAQQVSSGAEVALLLRQGREYEWHQNQGPTLISEFEDLRLPIEVPQPAPKRRVKALPTQELWPAQDLEVLAELEWRLSAPLSAFFLALLGLSLSPLRPREGRFKRLPAGLFLFAAFFYAGASLKKALAQGIISPLPGVYWAHLGLLLVSLILGYRYHRP